MADWDERYGRGDYATLEPSPLLARAVELCGAGGGADGRRALDLACGAGRHALLLAARGFRVTAVDASRVGVELTRARARERGLEVDARVADLERGEFRIEPDTYDLVCDFYYLQRDLFPALRAGVRRGGIFVAAIHLVDEDPRPRPMNPDFLLHPGELRAEFDGWQLLHYHETADTDADAGQHTRRSAEIIARRPAEETVNAER
jgi:tellurite methyltransferase